MINAHTARSFKAALAAAAGCLVLICSAVFAGDKEHTNIVFFLVDDLGWSDLGCNGSSFYETPNIDKLAAEGMPLYGCLCRRPYMQSDTFQHYDRQVSGKD